jgi:hypothetical protein
MMHKYAFKQQSHFQVGPADNWIGLDCDQCGLILSTLSLYCSTSMKQPQQYQIIHAIIVLCYAKMIALPNPLCVKMESWIHQQENQKRENFHKLDVSIFKKRRGIMQIQAFYQNTEKGRCCLALKGATYLHP